MVRREARRVSTITAETSLRQAQMRNKSGMSEEQAPGQLFITLGYPHHTVCHSAGEFARDEDGDGFCEIHVNTIEGFWSLLRSWLRPHRGVSQEKLPLYLGFFEFVHNVRKRGKSLLGTLVELLVTPTPRNAG